MLRPTRDCIFEGSVRHRSLISFLLLPLLACQAPEPRPARPPVPFIPTVAIRPLGLSLARGAAQDFRAEVNLPEGAKLPQTLVRWSVVEPGGGTITPEGHYTAPATPGLYHVRVQREDFPDLAATATVLVK